MHYIVRRLFLLPLVAALAGCGGGSSDSGAAAGATPFTGTWFLVVTLNVNVGGTATFLTDTSRVVVGAAGNAVVTETDTECSLNVSVNGNIMTYETTCIFTATTGDASAPCTLKLRTRATIRGAQGNARLSSSFGPKTEACSGAAASYTGTLVGSQAGFPDGGGTGDDTDGDTGTGEES